MASIRRPKGAAGVGVGVRAACRRTDEVLEKLRRCAPFVIVFNPEFSMIEAQSADASEVVAGIVDALADQRVRLTVLAHE